MFYHDVHPKINIYYSIDICEKKNTIQLDHGGLPSILQDYEEIFYIPQGANMIQRLELFAFLFSCDASDDCENLFQIIQPGYSEQDAINAALSSITSHKMGTSRWEGDDECISCPECARKSAQTVGRQKGSDQDLPN